MYDFAESRSGQHARTFLGDWAGKLVCDDYVGYKALFEKSIVEVGCAAHARRRFDELYANQRSELAAEALELFGKLYEIEREAREQQLDAAGRARLRQERARPIADALHQWLITHRAKVPDGSATANVIDYSLKRWLALTRYIDDGSPPIGRIGDWRGNHTLRGVAVVRQGRCLNPRRVSRFQSPLVEPDVQISRIRLSRMSLKPSLSPRLLGCREVGRGRLNDVLGRLPTQPVSRLEELLPHRWQPRPN